MTSSRRLLVLPLVAALAAPLVTPPPAEAAPCTLQKSCARRLFACFRPKGACRTAAVGAGAAACWDNGVQVDQQAGTGGRITVLARRGRPCVVGTIERGPAGEFQVAWRRKNRTLLFTAHADGTRSFTCPSGKVETYSAADFRAGQLCGRVPSAMGTVVEACTPGTCP